MCAFGSNGSTSSSPRSTTAAISPRRRAARKWSLSFAGGRTSTVACSRRSCGSECLPDAEEKVSHRFAGTPVELETVIQAQQEPRGADAHTQAGGAAHVGQAEVGYLGINVSDVQ